MALAFGLHSMGAGGSPTFSGQVTATRFMSSLTGNTNIILGTTLSGQGLGIGLDTGAGDINLTTSSVVWWKVSGSTGGWTSPAGGPITTTGAGSFGALSSNGATNFSGGAVTIGGANSLIFSGASVLQVGPSGGSINLANMAIVRTAPTISSGFGTSPSIVASNGSLAFQINVGTGGVATTGVIGLPAATTGWVVMCTNITTQTTVTQQTASTTTSATIGNFSAAAGAATAWAASDKINIIAVAY